MAPGGPHTLYSTGLLVHALLETFAGLGVLFDSASMFPHTKGMASVTHEKTAVFWFAVNIVIQGVIAFHAVAWPERIQEQLMRIFLVYHIVVAGQRSYTLYASGKQEDPSLGIVVPAHAFMTITFLGIMYIASVKRAAGGTTANATAASTVPGQPAQAAKKRSKKAD